MSNKGGEPNELLRIMLGKELAYMASSLSSSRYRSTSNDSKKLQLERILIDADYDNY